MSTRFHQACGHSGRADELSQRLCGECHGPVRAASESQLKLALGFGAFVAVGRLLTSDAGFVANLLWSACFVAGLLALNALFAAVTTRFRCDNCEEGVTPPALSPAERGELASRQRAKFGGTAGLAATCLAAAFLTWKFTPESAAGKSRPPKALFQDSVDRTTAQLNSGFYGDAHPAPTENPFADPRVAMAMRQAGGQPVIPEMADVLALQCLNRLKQAFTACMVFESEMERPLTSLSELAEAGHGRHSCPCGGGEYVYVRPVEGCALERDAILLHDSRPHSNGRRNVARTSGIVETMEESRFQAELRERTERALEK
ncbi:MAG: hypothetical protein FD180_4336 [Planctomycetota bacterium]|nr:MAG: hypothetical protein FD180_4336 [Planctomycetota bacterium]